MAAMAAGPLAAGGAAALLAGWSAPALAPVVRPVARALALPTRSARPGTVALTFDDGPHPEGTPAVLEILRAAGVHATFFLVGEQVQRSPALAREIVAAGHAVALHGHRHRNLLRLTPAAVAADLDRGAEAVAGTTGAALALHRAPYGIYSWAALRAVRERGLAPVLWSRWGHDWRRFTTPGRIAAEVTRDLTAGDVLLLHDADDYSAPGSWRNTVAALPRVLDAVAARGLGVEPLAGAADLAHPSGR
jgi:peptidoglycan/xylan/chitin deacetylase (PgdA/CDA1 family)